MLVIYVDSYWSSLVCCCRYDDWLLTVPSLAYSLNSRDQVARWALEEVESKLGPGFPVDGGTRLLWNTSKQIARAMNLMVLRHGPVLRRWIPVRVGITKPSADKR